MRFKSTLWTITDSCPPPHCQFETECDEDLPQGEKVVTYKRTHRVCPIHRATGLTGQELYDRAAGENTRKSFALALASEISGLPRDRFTWGYDDQRLLHISPKEDTTPEQKKLVQNALDLQFGPSKTIVD
ncbi:hypothetical protein LCGC14_1860830 [marine sediment metagenome]|uniref:Uncharacterized protein n=1 Tax=marine sediment metagenome TaxID=412755 RepID=A0A0F9G811_9ZZZZ